MLNHAWASITQVPTQPCYLWSRDRIDVIILCMPVACLLLLWKRLHENFFCSPSDKPDKPDKPLYPIPEWKPSCRLVGGNVRPISVSAVSVLLLQCVNAMPSKTTASLCVYCVRRWVLPFSPPLFMDLENASFVYRFWEINEWDWWWTSVRDWDWEWKRTSGRAKMNEILKVWKGLSVRWCWRARCLREVRRTCGFVRECERTEERTSVFLVTIKRTFLLHLEIPKVSFLYFFLSSLFFTMQWNV